MTDLAISYVSGGSAEPLLGQTIGAACVALVLARFGGQGPVVALGLGATAAILTAIVSSFRMLPGNARRD